jgi:hypothetical protein
MNKFKVESYMWLDYNFKDNTWTVKMRDNDNRIKKIITVENLKELSI